MESKSDRMEQNRSIATVGVITLAVVSLLAGASVAATLEDYAAPRYAEEDPFQGAVDDVTGEDTWEQKDSEERPMGKHIRKAMKSRMNDRMEDRTEHLEKRIEIDSNLIAAFQFCLDNADCTADSESLSETIEKLSWAVEGMRAKVDGTDSVTNEYKADKTDELQICIREENGVVHYDCDDDKYKDWDERKQWDETDRMEFAEEKSAQLRVAQEAIAFCMDSEDCSADSETIQRVLRHMQERAEHHRDCAEDRRCDRDHDHRKGLRGRLHAAMCKLTDGCDDRHGGDAPIYRPEIEITQEACESRMGVWTEATDRGEGVFYCDWGSAEDTSGSEQSEESRGENESDEADRQ